MIGVLEGRSLTGYLTSASLSAEIVLELDHTAPTSLATPFVKRGEFLDTLPEISRHPIAITARLTQEKARLP